MTESQVLLFTGAGFSTALPLGLPTMSAFVDRFDKKGLDPELGRLLQLLRSSFNARDLEALLRALAEVDHTTSTLARLVPSRTPVTTPLGSIAFQDLPRICSQLTEDVLSFAFDVYRLELGSDENEEIARRLFCPIIELIHKAQPERSLAFFTTNYDLAVEYFHRSTYGRKLFPSSLADGFQTSGNDSRRVFTGDFMEEETGPVLRLFKLHGSLNWRRSLVRKSVEHTGFIQERPTGVDMSSESVVIFPAGLKHPELANPFRTLLGKWTSYLRNASSCLFIGYSFGDPHISSTVVEAIASWDTRIVVVSPHATRNVREKLLAPAFGHARTDEILHSEAIVCVDAPYAGDLVVQQIAKGLGLQ